MFDVGAVSPRTLTVPSEAYSTIQAAINGANPGDTVFVLQGNYSENLIVNQTLTLLGQSRDLTIIDGGRISNVITVTADDVTVQGFTLQNSSTVLGSATSNGIIVDHSNRSTIIGNKIVMNRNGIELDSSMDCTITENLIVSNSDNGIALSSSEDNMLSNNNVSSNNLDGISLVLSQNNTVSGNTLNDNGYRGINLISSVANTIVRNEIATDYYGISLLASTSGKIAGNSFVLNEESGIFLDSHSDNGIIYHNNFLSNTNQVQSKDSINEWYFSGEGNYWSDYNGTDSNGDGIGDSPYVINALNVDGNPLMGNYSEFVVELGIQDYEVEVISNSSVASFEFTTGAVTGNRIIYLNVTGQQGTVGFCRLRIPQEVMTMPFIVMTGDQEISPTLISADNQTGSQLYFTYANGNFRITIISSITTYLYDELVQRYNELKNILDYENSSYSSLLGNYSDLLANYSEQANSYVYLLGNYSELAQNYASLLGNYSQLVQRLDSLNQTSQQQSLAFSQNADNFRALLYIFGAAAAIFLVATVYLSSRLHKRPETKYADA